MCNSNLVVSTYPFLWIWVGILSRFWTFAFANVLKKLARCKHSNKVYRWPNLELLPLHMLEKNLQGAFPKFKQMC
jgi:hypothetical protein